MHSNLTNSCLIFLLSKQDYPLEIDDPKHSKFIILIISQYSAVIIKNYQKYWSYPTEAFSKFVTR